MIGLGLLLVVVGVLVYGAARLREPEDRRFPRPDEVERAIEAGDDR